MRGVALMRDTVNETGLIERVARDLLGEPNGSLSSHGNMRFGTHGSLSIDKAKDVWSDHEDGEGGGVFDLIVREQGGTRADARRWCIERSHIAPDNARTFEYRDEHGTLLYRVVRSEPKSFRQQAADGSWSIKGVPRVPYRLPELLAADPTYVVYIVEGEKDADRLAALGLVATTNSGGASKSPRKSNWLPEFSDHLKGRRVCILPDNDDAGRNHAAQVANTLVARGIDHRIVDLPNLPEKGDVSDWLDMGGTPAALIQLYDAPRVTMPSGMPQPGPAPSDMPAGPRNTFRHSSLSLICDDKGRPVWNMHNAIALLSQHSDWQGVLAFNEFTIRRVLLRAVPGQGGGVYPRPLEDDDYTAAQAWFNNNGFPKASMEIVGAAVRKVCRHQAFDPLRDYLDGLQWDGTPRLASWLTTYCGAEPSAYVSEVGRRWCISAVARGFKPGVKADCMLVLEGAQGRRKSSALAALAGEDWFSDALPQMGTKDASSYLRGKWIIEVAELEAMRKEMDAIKAFISRQVETYRPAYGREEVSEPRRCIFAGSTNKDDWQRDETGGRRFWPVKVGSIDVDAIARDRGQLWAEAVHLYRAGERWWLEGEIADQAQAEVAERRPDDPWRADIARVVEGRAEVATKEVLHELRVVPTDMTPQLSKRVAGQLLALGWVRDGRVTTGQMKGAARYVPGEGQ
jgi:predicted P-loop ATPase/5S rRNA maturation endonuclease (ribonuclease M5)